MITHEPDALGQPAGEQQMQFLFSWHLRRGTRERQAESRETGECWEGDPQRSWVARSLQIGGWFYKEVTSEL